MHHGAAEIALLDTPGLHRPRNELGRVMNQTAREAARAADVVVFVTEVPHRAASAPDGGGAPSPPHPGDLTLLADIAADKPTVLVVNKVDRVRDKSRAPPAPRGARARSRAFAAVVPISALDATTASRRVLDEVADAAAPRARGATRPTT